MTKNYFVKANEILKNKLNGKKNILKNISIENLTLMAVRDYS
jgi:hypothetical protein